MILIVDDKPENILSLKSVLSLHSFPTDSASSGEEALKKVLKNNYALIILDVQMPDMDGFEVAEAISGYSKTKDVPIIFLSAANTDKRFITRGYSSGGIDYITKPIDPEILLLKVKTFYKLYEQTRQLNEMQDSLRSEIEFRKKAQQEINDKALELKFVLESIPQIAFTTKANGTIEYRNSQWMSYAESEKDFPVTHPDDVCIADELKKMVKKGKPIELEVRVKKHKQQEYRYHLLRVLPVKENNVIVKWVGTFTDIDDQKQTVKRKDEFISIASHELKTPLTSIKGYVQLLDRINHDNASRLYIERTLLQIRKLDSLIADLLDISKIESGKLKFNMQFFDIDTMIENTIEITSQTHTDYTIQRIGKGNIKVLGDEIRLEQVLINLLSNAIKYSPQSKEIQVVTKLKPSNKLFIGIKDFGIGISQKDQQNIFQKYYRTEVSTHNFQGLGIGLYICAEILRRHNFEFGVESEPGKGSLFYFLIPLNN
jgi:signal transduction histidine kinase